MESASRSELERLVATLNDDRERARYEEPLRRYRPSLLPRILGALLVGSGNFVYGKNPSYLKFRAVEVIARVPYHSWVSAAFTLLTLFYADERRALRLSTISEFARIASDNETMHVVVISKLAREHERAGAIRHTLIPMLFAFLYFWASYLLYLCNPKWSLELNYLFENHAYEQYSLFLTQCEHALKTRPIQSEYLSAYGRYPRSQYEFFESVRNDELIHRNRSIHEIGMHTGS